MGQRTNFRKTLPALRTIVLLFMGMASASAQDSDPNTGFPPFGSFSNGSFDHIDRANLNINFSIPIASIHGRGISLPASITYDSLMWKKQTGGGIGVTPQWVPVVDSSNNPTWGWKIDNLMGDVKHAVTMELLAQRQELSYKFYCGELGHINAMSLRTADLNGGAF